MSDERMKITLRCGCSGEILDDGSIIITSLCANDAIQILEMEEDE